MTDAGFSKRVLNEGGESFEVMVLEAAKPCALVLFAVGAGGDPERHLPLLHFMAARGCTVVAPRFERLTSPPLSADVLARRARRLQLALDDIAQPHLPTAGVGHSIGAALLLMLAGAEACTIAKEVVRVPPERRLSKLALFAPATDFFRAPGALQGVRASIVAWAGTRDEITPPATARLLEDVLQGTASVDVRIVAGAGHFSFMDTPPPHAAESLEDRDVFLEHLAEDVTNFITG